jgi:hypothetical protein
MWQKLFIPLGAVTSIPKGLNDLTRYEEPGNRQKTVLSRRVQCDLGARELVAGFGIRDLLFAIRGAVAPGLYRTRPAKAESCRPSGADPSARVTPLIFNGPLWCKDSFDYPVAPGDYDAYRTGRS